MNPLCSKGVVSLLRCHFFCKWTLWSLATDGYTAGAIRQKARRGGCHGPGHSPANVFGYLVHILSTPLRALLPVSPRTWASKMQDCVASRHGLFSTLDSPFRNVRVLHYWARCRVSHGPSRQCCGASSSIMQGSLRHARRVHRQIEPAAPRAAEVHAEQRKATYKYSTLSAALVYQAVVMRRLVARCLWTA